MIETIPDIFHAGHVHVEGITEYKGALAVNSGTWQGQTKFQKQVNITPTPARAVAVDLQTLQPQVMDFAG